MSGTEPDARWAKVLTTHQFWAFATFVFLGTWAVQELLDQHLHSGGEGFASGYLHFIRKLDHLLVFLAGGLLMGSRSRLVRYTFPFGCAGTVVVGWVIWDWDWPWAHNSMLPLLFLVVAFLGLPRLRILPVGGLLAFSGWLFLCHLDSKCEFGAGAATEPAFVAGLGATAFLSAALGVVIGEVLVERRSPYFRIVTTLILLLVALAVATN